MSRFVPFLRHPPATTFLDTTATIVSAQRARTHSVATNCATSGTRWKRRRRQENKRGGGGDGDDSGGRRALGGKRQSANIEHIFVSSLVAAGTCREHRRSDWPTRRFQSGHIRQLRPYSTSSTSRDRAMTMSDGDLEFSREELDELVEQYEHGPPAIDDHRESPYSRHSDLTQPLKPAHLPLAPRLMLTPEQELPPLKPPDPHHAPRERSNDSEQLRALLKILRLHRSKVNLDGLWHRYRTLPAHLANMMTIKQKHRLLNLFGLVEDWNEAEARQRYDQILNDYENANVPIEKKHWTTALAFAGRSIPRVTNDRMKSAIELWMRMEDRGKVADHVTFNILFDTAVRVGRYALADTIHNEMKSRGMPLDRYFRASMIHYAGLKRNGDGVRRAFRECVGAGEIVDTTLMNAVILALLRAQEPASAEHVLLRMKQLHEEKMKLKTPTHWLEQKDLRRVLNKTAQELREMKKSHESSFFGAPFASDDRREEVQQLSPIEPNANTYAQLIEYHAYTSANIDRIWDLLGEMRERGLEVPARVFVTLLKGFRSHGGYAFSAWSHHRLEDLWTAVIGPIDSAKGSSEAHSKRDTDLKHELRSHKFNDPASEALRKLFIAQQAARDQEERNRKADLENRRQLDRKDEDARIRKADLEDRSQFGLAVEDADPAQQPEMHSVAGDDRLAKSAHANGLSTQGPLHDASVSDDASLFYEWLPPSDSSISASKPDTPLLDASYNKLSQPSADTEAITEELKHSASWPGPVEQETEEAGPLNSTSYDDQPRPRPGAVPVQDNGAYWPMTVISHWEQNKLASDAYHAGWETKREESLYDPQPVYRRPFHPPHRPSRPRPVPTSAQHEPGAPSSSEQGDGEPPVIPSCINAEIALAAVRAFFQCCGKKRMMQVWDQISAMWTDSTEEDRDMVSRQVHKLKRHAEVTEGTRK